jgi:hypothetical protein
MLGVSWSLASWSLGLAALPCAGGPQLGAAARKVLTNQRAWLRQRLLAMVVADAGGMRGSSSTGSSGGGGGSAAATGAAAPPGSRRGLAADAARSHASDEYAHTSQQMLHLEGTGTEARMRHTHQRVEWPPPPPPLPPPSAAATAARSLGALQASQDAAVVAAAERAAAVASQAPRHGERSAAGVPAVMRRRRRRTSTAAFVGAAAVNASSHHLVQPDGQQQQLPLQPQPASILQQQLPEALLSMARRTAPALDAAAASSAAQPDAAIHPDPDPEGEVAWPEESLLRSISAHWDALQACPASAAHTRRLDFDEFGQR